MISKWKIYWVKSTDFSREREEKQGEECFCKNICIRLRVIYKDCNVNVGK